MRWSKLKQLIEARFTESLRGRLELHVTRYRKSHPYKWSELGEFWMTLDGSQIVSFSDGEYYACSSEYKLRLAEIGDEFPTSSAYEAARLVQYPVPDILDLLFSSMSSSVEDMLEDENALVRSLALADSRLGKRRLNSIRRDDLPSQLEQRIFDLRMGLEGAVALSPVLASSNVEASVSLDR